MTLRRPGLRGRLQVAVTVGIAVVLAVLTTAFNVLLAKRLDRDATDVVKARASAQLAAIRFVHGHPYVAEAPDEKGIDSPVWVFAGRRLIESPRTHRLNDRAAAGLARRSRRARRDLSQTDTRLYSLPIVDDGRQLGAVVGGVSLEPYERTRRAALIGSIGFAAAVLVAVALATRWLIAGALRPVARMTGQAAVWSERDLDRRFSLGEARDEFTQLAATLDRLLDRLASSLRHEQRFSAELSHELRTPLAGIIAEAQLALRQERPSGAYREGFQQVLMSARQMARTLDALVAAARTELSPQRSTSDAHDCAQAAARACAALAQREGVGIDVQRPAHPLRVSGDADLVERILFPILENACRYGARAVRIDLAPNTGVVLFTIDDDGPGVTSGEQATIFEPGLRGSAARSVASGNGAGLGLALSRRLARAAGGDIEVGSAGRGGRFVVRLPAA
jgi:two-component system, OmpR family, sensor kinase